MSHRAQRPILSTDAPVHYAKFPYKGGILCEELRDCGFGALWNGPNEHVSIAGDAGSAEPSFAFTDRFQYVTCVRCLELLSANHPALMSPEARARQASMPTDNIFCVRMGFPELMPDHVTRALDLPSEELKKTTWCGRRYPENEPTFATIAHAAHALYEMNGIKICDVCVDTIVNLLRRNAAERD